MKPEGSLLHSQVLATYPNLSNQWIKYVTNGSCGTGVDKAEQYFLKWYVFTI